MSAEPTPGRPNAWSVYRRDLGRLARVSKAWIIIIGVIVTPSLYAWFNIVAFWDPYSNTQQVSVAIVDQDEGASSELTGRIDIGGELVGQLKQNDKLGWTFVDEDEAMDAVRSGSSYAAIIIPPDFSRDFLSITTGDFTRPELTYYVNEKANAIAPKITDVGASTLDNQINSTFVSTVAEAVSEQLRKAGLDAEDRLGDARDSTVSALDDATAKISSARVRLTELRTGLDDAGNGIDRASGTLDTVDRTLGEVQGAVAEAQRIAAEAQQELLTLTDSVTSAYVSGSTLIADAAARMNGSIATLAAGLQQANVAVGTTVDDLTAVIETNADALDELQAVLDDTQPGSEAAQRLGVAIDALKERNTADQRVLTQLTQLNDDVSSTITAVTGAADSVSSAVSQAAESATAIRDALTTSVPQLNRAMSQLSASADAFSSALGAQRTQVAQAQGLLAGLKTQLAGTSDALAALDGNLAAAENGLGTVRTDVLALGSADIWNRLSTVSGLEPDEIARFMASPVEVSTNAMFPTAAYGSAMAALFTNLSLWIGAFVLMVIMRVEVDTEGVEGITVRQAYIGRWLLFATIAVFQAVLVCVGNLVIGVQTANAFAYVGTGVLIGLAYLSIIYALSVCFGIVGKGLCILLVIFQIPGASGLYPIEMMPAFFRGLYPFLPFTYGIDAMRETISGFYGLHWWRFMGTLALFVTLAWLLGLFLRGRLGSFALLFNRRLAETGLMISEDVQITGRRRTPEIIRALTDGDGFRADVAQRAQRFGEHYRTRLRLTLLVGAAGIVVLALCGWLIPDAKAVVLGLAALWCLLLIGFVVTLEYIRQSIEQAAEVGEMPDAELRRALSVENSGKGELLAGAAASVGAATSASAAAGGVSAADPSGPVTARTAALDHPDAVDGMPADPAQVAGTTADPDDDTVVFDELFAEDAAQVPDMDASAAHPAEDDAAEATTETAAESIDAESGHPEPGPAPDPATGTDTDKTHEKEDEK
ncbi:YhgE/Pip domain-containing protein [Microbacterium esteraromaticum]|uniref:YhgE/Pip domain-containing protein n=1 Tax=Microbacterium esteraromaticum TaxID=57043 RepID=UPI001C70FD4C|nr:YhgE/Pip domain-containing protein [Microbacterium esteraromaticum]